MWSLHPISFEAISGWSDDDHGAALAAFQRQSMRPPHEGYRTGSIGLKPERIDALVDLALLPQAKRDPKRFFEANFDPFRIVCANGNRGQITGFYEPEVEARRDRDGEFATPLLKRPHDLVNLNADNRPASMDAEFRFGRRKPDGSIVVYDDRAQINRKNLDELAIAWLKDPVDAFFIHVQGAACLKMENGRMLRVTYDGKNGHPFTAIGKLLVERGEISREAISMQAIRKWLAINPDKSAALMEENRSYIFFKETRAGENLCGPVAAAKVPLTPGRSLAVDRLIHTFSTPIFVNADSVNGRPFNRLMIAQETGTAIIGPARGDIFFGTGDEAGADAGAVNAPCDFIVLVPCGIGFDHVEVKLP